MKFFTRTETTPDSLQEAIDRLYLDLRNYPPMTEDYNSITDQIVKLKKLQKEVNHSWKPSPDALVGAAGSVLGIVMILNYERLGVVTSKAVSFVRQMKS